MRLDGDLLDGAAGAGARVLALARLADAEEAAARLVDPGDAGALGDFRIATGRLRSTLRLLAPALQGALTEMQLKRLARVARRTGPAREAEVLGAWLEEARARLGAPYRGALDWLVDRVALRRADAARRVHLRALPDFRRLAPRLAGRLSARSAAVAGGPASLAALLAGALRAQARALREALGQVVGGEDGPGLRRAGLEARRLRSLLEPLRGLPGGGATAAVTALDGMLALLGAWRDQHRARQALAGALVAAAADRVRRDRGAGSGDLRPGLLALDQLAARQAAEAYAALAEGYLASRATALLDLAYAVVAELEGAVDAGPGAAAPERRLLLTGLPEEVAGGAIEEVARGWLPGLSEHMGVVRSAGGERRFRARPTRRGAIELAPLTPADFEAWWPLTEGRRLEHRSLRLATLPGWRFDQFPERRLVLAVIEAADAAPIPAWLEPAVVRDVTDERGYRDEALARRGPRRD